MKSLTLAVALLAVDQSWSFGVEQSRSAASSEASRRSFFSQVASSAAVASGLGSLPLPALAVSGMNKVNAKLKAYGLPTYASVPDGFAPLLEVYGKGKNRFPLLVSFAYPLSWVVTLPSNDVNGEDGTVQAGDYGKGDTATFFVYQEPGHISDITSQPKDLFEKALQKCIGQKGNNQFQNFKVTKLEPVSVDDQKYMLADFKYQLLTGAGFEVDRQGHASITSEGPAVEVLWAASTAQRYKKTSDTLKSIVASFRCYAEGINLSDELVRNDLD